MIHRALQEAICELMLEFPKHDLGSWTSGNASIRDSESSHVAIKPSGVPPQTLSIDDVAVLSLDGKQLEGRMKPSSDAESHLYIYRNLPTVMAIVHTHSPYATAFAAVGKTIPFCLTELADITKWSIPCIAFVVPGGENIGRAVVRAIGNAPAVLLSNHGVLAVGLSGEAALKAAVVVEHAARVSWLAAQIGEPLVMSSDDVTRVYEYHKTSYGQASAKQGQ